MRKINYHTHTTRCFHASGSDEEFVIAAIKGGYTELGFSDHTPWKYDSNFVATMRMPLSEFADYYQSISNLKKKYADKIKIKIGLECEYYPKYMKWLKKFIIKNEIDYIILGNHYYKSDEEHIYYGSYCSDPAILEMYVNESIEAMKSGMYSYMAHPDLFMRSYLVFDDFAAEQSRRLCEGAKAYGVPLEYNLAGANYNLAMNTVQYPHPAFWKIVGEVGNDVIIGVDAHVPEALTSSILREEGLKILTEYGCKIIDEMPFVDFSKLQKANFK